MKHMGLPTLQKGRRPELVWKQPRGRASLGHSGSAQNDSLQDAEGGADSSMFTNDLWGVRPFALLFEGDRYHCIWNPCLLYKNGRAEKNGPRYETSLWSCGGAQPGLLSVAHDVRYRTETLQTTLPEGHVPWCPAVLPSQCGLTANTFDDTGWQQAACWRHEWSRMAEHTYPRYICERGSGSPCQRRPACVLWELPGESGASVWQTLGHPALLEFSVAFAGQPVTEVQKSDRKATGG